MMSGAGRLVLVTGASRGIGRAIAEAFGRQGARVVVNHPGEEEAAGETAALVTRAGGEPFLYDADVSDPAAIDAMDEWTAQLGTVDVLVNNAGICPFQDFFALTVEEWDRVHGVNLRGAFLLTQAVSKRMVARGEGGRIISVSSISAFTGGEFQAHYCASKGGLTAFMKSIALKLAPFGITCNCVLPGVIETDINRKDLENVDKRRSLESRIPLGLGRPSDVAGAVTLLASPDAGYVTGAELVCDGGLTINPGT